jgi:hypothetical protein
MTLRVEILCPRAAMAQQQAAHTAEIALIGMPSGSSAKTEQQNHQHRPASIERCLVVDGGRRVLQLFGVVIRECRAGKTTSAPPGSRQR